MPRTGPRRQMIGVRLDAETIEQLDALVFIRNGQLPKDAMSGFNRSDLIREAIAKLLR